MRSTSCASDCEGASCSGLGPSRSSQAVSVSASQNSILRPPSSCSAAVIGKERQPGNDISDSADSRSERWGAAAPLAVRAWVCTACDAGSTMTVPRSLLFILWPSSFFALHSFFFFFSLGLFFSLVLLVLACSPCSRLVCGISHSNRESARHSSHSGSAGGVGAICAAPKRLLH